MYPITKVVAIEYSGNHSSFTISSTISLSGSLSDIVNYTPHAFKRYIRGQREHRCPSGEGEGLKNPWSNPRGFDPHSVHPDLLLLLWKGRSYGVGVACRFVGLKGFYGMELGLEQEPLKRVRGSLVPTPLGDRRRLLLSGTVECLSLNNVHLKI